MQRAGQLWSSPVAGLALGCESIYSIYIWTYRVQYINLYLNLLLLLSHVSHVQLCATPQTAAHQAPPSLGFSRQEHWSGLPLPSPMHESEKWKWSRLVVSDPQRPHGLQPTRLLHPWDFPGKSTGVGCHYLLRYLNLYKFNIYLNLKAKKKKNFSGSPLLLWPFS